MQYISDIIKDDYLHWKDQFVLISSHTGSGKTTFVLNQLLNEAINQKKYILYLCNRRLLLDQFSKSSFDALRIIFPDIKESDLPEEKRKHLLIMTYQYLESQKFPPNCIYPPQDYAGLPQDEINWLKGWNINRTSIPISTDDILYFVYDEAHYFLADSLFNAKCNYWFNRFYLPPMNFNEKPIGTHIFLTATPELLKVFLAAHSIVSFSHNNHFVFNTPAQDIEKDFIKKATNFQSATAPQKIFNVDLNTKESKLEYKYPDQKTHNALLKEANNICPGQKFIECILNQTEKLRIKEYRPQNPFIYKNMETSYWRTYDSIIKKICQEIDPPQSDINETCNETIIPKEKWMIFVNNEKDGEQLEKELIDKNINAVFLSSSRLQKNLSNVHQEFHNIIENSTFNCTVLIATSIIDCGVSIKDPTVKNIVISACEKTTFLQLLGRKRLAEDEQIHLYIRFFSRGFISAKKQHYEEMLRVMTDFIVHRQTCFYPSPLNSSDFLYEKRYNAPLSKMESDLETSFLREYTSLFYKYYSGSSFNSNQKQEYLKMLMSREPGNSAFIYSLYLLFSFFKILKANYEDTVFYLREQLQWLGQTYLKDNWLNLKEMLAQLNKKLQEYQHKKIIKYTKEAKEKINVTDNDAVSSEQFSKECMDILKGCQMPTISLDPWILKTNRGKLPNSVALNHIFKELNIMYEIKSHQKSYHGKRVSMWVIEHKSNK